MKRFTLLSLIICLCALSACGTKNNDWDIAKAEQRYQTVSFAENVSAFCLNQDSLYLQEADSGNILQYGGGNLLAAPNSNFTRTDDAKLIVADWSC